MKIYLSVDEKGVIQHYGVKGMKWGVRRQLNSIRNQGAKRIAANKTVEGVNFPKQIRDANSKGNYKKADKLRGEYQQISKERAVREKEVRRLVKQAARLNPNYTESKVRKAVRKVLLGKENKLGSIPTTTDMFVAGTPGGLARSYLRNRSYSRDEFDRLVMKELRKNGK